MVALGAEILPEKWDSPLKKKKIFMETLFHSVATQKQAVVTLFYHSFHLMAIVCVMATLLLN